MKKLLLALGIIAIATFANAQSSSAAHGTMFSIGVDGSFPMGTFNDAGYKFGIGGTVQVEQKVASELGLTLNAGYQSFSNTSGGYKFHFNVIPVRAGVKYYFSPKFFAHGQLGAAFNSVSFSGGGSSSTSTEFTYALGVGTQISRNLTLGVHYMSDDVYNWFGVNLAVGFGGK